MLENSVCNHLHKWISIHIDYMAQDSLFQKGNVLDVEFL